MRVDLYKDLYLTEEAHWWHISKRRLVKEFIGRYSRKNKLTILDVGCGTGKNMEELSRFGEVWGVDFSKEALSFCRKRGITNIKKGKAEHLPYGDNSFDLVCVLDVLEHVDDVVVIAEIRRVLQNEGLLVITVPAFQWLWSRWDVELHHKRRYLKEELEKLLKNEGFEIKRNTYIYSFLMIPLYVVRKLKQFSSKSYTSDFQLGNKIVNAFFLFLSKLEQIWINRYDMPFGTSILCIAQKRNVKLKSPL